MRSFLLCFALALNSCFGAKQVTPVSATIVDFNPAATGWRIGNVRVLFSDGHSENWTLHGRALMPAVSSKGWVGWAVVTRKIERIGNIDGKLRICRPDGHYRDFEPDAAVIEKWQFSNDGKTVIVKSRGLHGPASYNRYDIATGKLLGDTGGGARGDALPDWARPLSD